MELHQQLCVKCPRRTFGCMEDGVQNMRESAYMHFLSQYMFPTPRVQELKSVRGKMLQDGEDS